MTNQERVSQYEQLNNVLSIKITDTITRHNIICNIIDNNETKKVLNLNK